MSSSPSKSLALGAATALLLTLVGLSPASAEPAIDGAQTSGDSLFPHVGNGGYDVSHYDIDLAYDADSKAIDATTTIDATADQPLSSFSLDFEGLTIDSVTVDGVAAPYERVVDADTITYKLVVTPATPVSGDFTTVVTYSGVPTSHTDPDGSSEGWIQTSDGATAVNEPIGAMTFFPNNNTMRDKATFDVELTVPTTIDGAPAAAVSNGELASKVVDGATTTWSWEQTEQMATYLALVSIGKFTVHEGDISLGGGRTIKEYSFVDSDIPSGDVADIEASRAEIGPMLRYLEGKFGPYPGNSTGVVVDNTDVGYALETQDRPFFEGSLDVDTQLHELTHQWFGDSVSATDWSDLWLAEGPATFMEAAYAYDTGASDTSPEDHFFSAWQDSNPASSTWTTPMAGFTDPADLFGGQTYNRGARSLQALRTKVGTRVFDSILSTWIARRAGSTGSTADWIALAEELSGRNLTAFYQDWAYDTDKPAWPSAYTPPVVAGTRKVGETLTAVPGDWDPAATLSYQWFAGGSPVAGADAQSFTPTAAVLGRRLTVTVTGVVGSHDPVSRTSAATGPVGSGYQTKHPTPTISGTPKVHRTLTVRPGTWDAGTTLSYQWYVDGHRVSGGKDGSLTVPRAAVGDRITVRVTSTRPGYYSRSELSAKTAKVS